MSCARTVLVRVVEVVVRFVRTRLGVACSLRLERRIEEVRQYRIDIEQGKLAIWKPGDGLADGLNGSRQSVNRGEKQGPDERCHAIQQEAEDHAVFVGPEGVEAKRVEELLNTCQ